MTEKNSDKHLIKDYDRVSICSVYRNAFDKNPTRISIPRLVEKIKTSEVLKRLRFEFCSLTTVDERLLFKQTKLPAITVSGIFANGHGSKNLISHSGLLQIDIDNISVEAFRSILAVDKYSFILYNSISGNGIKIFVKIDSTNHLGSFHFLEQYYKTSYGLTIDKKCKDVGRLCFLNYDPFVTVNYQSEICLTSKTNIVESISNATLLNTQSYTVDIESIVKQVELRKIDITAGYENWLKIGFALANVLGENGRSYFHRLSIFNPTYVAHETDIQYTHCLKSSNSGITQKSFFYIAKQHGIISKPN
ncbi:MAG: BT4734/BF3469 family protein [Chitinophagaceae bacterium]